MFDKVSTGFGQSQKFSKRLAQLILGKSIDATWWS